MDKTITINNVPRSILYARTERDIIGYLQRTAKEQNLTSDDICMMLRNINLEFERKRADDYTSTMLKQMGQIQILEQENKRLKEVSQLFDMEDKPNDKSDDKS